MPETQYGDMGGVLCAGCGAEVFRILEGVCMTCLNGRNHKKEVDIEMSAALDGVKQQMTRAKKNKARAVEDYWKGREGP